MLQISRRLNECTLAFAHLLAVNGQKPVDKQFVWQPQVGTHQHSRPKQGMEIHDIFTDEVVYLVFVTIPEIFEIQAVFITIILDRRHVADRGIEPHVEVFIVLVGNLKSKLGPIP